MSCLMFNMVLITSEKWIGKYINWKKYNEMVVFYDS